jgi:ketosteroid isomerase-like protein
MAEPGLQYLLDRAAIHDVLIRYFLGIDLGDRQQVRNCFTDDVKGFYHARPPVRGIEALMNQIPSFAKQASGEWKISTHFMGNLHFKSLDADVAETETHAFAFLVLTTTTPPDQVAMRSLRYLDRFVRLDGQWRISERMHTLDWAAEVPSNFAAALAERKGARPANTPD